MAVLTKDGILSFHDPGQSAHQNASLAGQVTVDFIFERGGEQVPRTDCNTGCQSSLGSSPGVVLLNSVAAVDAASIQKVRPDARP